MFVDARVQGALLLRVVVYWFLALLVVSQLLICWHLISGSTRPFVEFYRFDQLWQDHASVLLAAFMLLPVILLDTVLLSNRFVGPFHRIRRALRELASGATVAPLEFRDRDFWRDAAKDVNALIARLEQLEKRAAGADHPQVAAHDEHEWEPAASH
jgi:hypothetical protein